MDGWSDVQSLMAHPGCQWTDVNFPTGNALEVDTH